MAVGGSMNFILHYMPSAEIPYIYDIEDPDKIIYSKYLTEITMPGQGGYVHAHLSG
jgi:hypothetical protein